MIREFKVGDRVIHVYGGLPMVIIKMTETEALCKNSQDVEELLPFDYIKPLSASSA